MTEERGLVKYEARDGQQVTLSFDTIKRYLVQGHAEMVTQQELMFFMGTCKSRGLNPFNKDCYLIKYSTKQGAAIITAVDYFRKRAKAQRDCHGWQKGIIVDRKGEVFYSKGLMLDDDILLGGWFKAQPEGWVKPFELEVNLKGYIKKKSDGSVTKFWQKENQPTQIAKVAESQGLRTLWPDEFQQLYTVEEMGEPDSFKGAESIITDKAADLTEKIKEKPDNTATELKDKLDEGDKQVEGYSAMKPTVESQTGAKLEPGEPQGVLPKGTDATEWMVACRPSSSVSNAKAFIAVFKEQKEAIEAMTDVKIKTQLKKKLDKTNAYLGEIAKNKKLIAEEQPPVPEEDRIPGFEQETGVVLPPNPNYDANGRMAFLKAMKEYKNLNSDIYASVLMDNDWEDMNSITPSDQEVALGFMDKAFEV